MPKPTGSAPRSAELSPSEMSLLGDPLDLISQDHLRIRHICALMDVISGLPSEQPSDISDARHFLAEELAAHVADEEQDLYPMLRKRCAPEDEIDATLDGLCKDHVDVTVAAIECLEILNQPTRISQAGIRTLRAFASHKRQHLIVENAILLPLARVRLLPEDLTELLTHMVHRRGLSRIFGGTG